MKALVYTAKNKVEMQTLDDPVPKAAGSPVMGDMDRQKVTVGKFRQKSLVRRLRQKRR